MNNSNFIIPINGYFVIHINGILYPTNGSDKSYKVIPIDGNFITSIENIFPLTVLLKWNTFLQTNNFLLKSIPQGIPIDRKLYHFKGKFYPTNRFVKVIPFKGKYSPTNRSVKVKNFFRKWFLLSENNLPQTDPLKWKISSESNSY